jgi:putative flippase GtrA
MASPATVVPLQRVHPALKFGLVGLLGLLINQAAFMLLTDVAGVYYVVSAILATQVSSTWNFLGSEYWAFSDRDGRGTVFSRYLAFLGFNNLSLVLRVPMLWLLVAVGIAPAIANPISLVALTLLRFLFADNLLWQRAAVARNPSSHRSAEDKSVEAPPMATIANREAYDYAIAGVLHVRSDVRLPELAYFLTDDVRPPDIRIEETRVGGLPSVRTRFLREGPTLGYYEHLGLAGANFRVTMGDPIVVQVAPLLARSPHVLYTNVIEALLRFLLVSRGYVLLHSACIGEDGHAALLSAQTDTGKTSTVIQLVRERGYEFLSDDMTIVAPDGRAICYPKPMTLSFHTMSSIKGEDLTWGQRAALAIQSRLHSKSGRSIGQSLGTMNIPIMSVNSVVQMLVPPPKFGIDDLLSATIGTEAEIATVVLMERGEFACQRIELDDAIGTLIDNTDDAYGFPPFATFAPHVRIDGMDYPALRAKELELLRQALTNARIYRITVPGHEWAEVLPRVLDGDGVDFGDGQEPTGSRLVPIPIESRDEATHQGRR